MTLRAKTQATAAGKKRRARRFVLCISRCRLVGFSFPFYAALFAGTAGHDGKIQDQRDEENGEKLHLPKIEKAAKNRKRCIPEYFDIAELVDTSHPYLIISSYF